jgi:DNA polymerase-3 subunit epsilon
LAASYRTGNLRRAETIVPIEPDATDFVAFDLETTGLFPESDRIVEIGAIRFDSSGREIAQFQRLVNPGRPMAPQAQAIHGISDADLADAPGVDQVLPEFLDWLGPAPTPVLLAHNAGFDAGFLGREFTRIGRPIPSLQVVDTLALARRHLPGARDHKLETLARALGLDAGGPMHRALADARRVFGLWMAFPPIPSAEWLAFPLHDPAASLPIPTGWELMKQAIRDAATVRMVYQGGSRGIRPRAITPRRFSLQGGAVYLVAFCHLDQYEKSFRLDRVGPYELADPPTAPLEVCGGAG